MKVRGMLVSLAVIGSLMGTAVAAEVTNEEEMQNLPKEQRVEMMNQLKTRLANMSEQERAQEMQKYAQQEGSMQRQQVRTQAMQHVNEMQMQTNEQMQQRQNMNQKHAGEQYMHESQIGTEMPSGSFNPVRELPVMSN